MIMGYSPPVTYSSLMLCAKDFLFKSDASLDVDIVTVLQLLLNTAKSSHEDHQYAVDEFCRLAEFHGVDVSNVEIPPCPPQVIRVAPRGPLYDQSGKILSLVIQGDVASVRDIDDAARLMSSMTMPIPF